MPGSELPADNIPRAIVQRVESEIDGKTATTTIQLGGQRYSPYCYCHSKIISKR